MATYQKYKTIRHFHRPGDCHELTFSCYERLPLLTDQRWLPLLAESIDGALARHGLNLSAYVFMPEHMHLLVWPTDPREADIGEFLKTLKLSVSTKVKHRMVQERNAWLPRLAVRERPGKTCFRFWQEGPGYDRNLYEPDTVLASIEYIHMNPVRRGLCNRPEAWEWSSYRHYLGNIGYPPSLGPRWSRLPAEFLQ